MTATLSNNISKSVSTTFIPILSISVETTANNAIASLENNTVKARIVDGQGKPVANVKVDFSSVGSGLVLTPSSGTTNSHGEISSSISRSNSTGGTFAITAKMSDQVGNSSSDVNFLTLHKVSNIIAPSNKTFYTEDGFPTTGYPNAKFQINASGNAESNSNYAWTSSDSSSATVDSAGNVTLSANSLNKSINITAKDNTNAYRYTFKVTRWFQNLSKLNTHIETGNACAELGMRIPERDHLTLGQNNRRIGSLWSEWARPSGWPTGDINTAYWTVTDDGYSRVYLVIMSDGGSISKDSHGAYIEYGVCTKS